jgi:hypothetical protein
MPETMANSSTSSVAGRRKPLDRETGQPYASSIVSAAFTAAVRFFTPSFV